MSGASGGGTVLLGGDYQGQGVVPTAEQTIVGPNVLIAADALTSGDGGRVIVWADDATRFEGSISAQGGPQEGDGGFVEVSTLRLLDFSGLVNTQATQGESGQLLLDPVNILIADTPDAGYITIEQADGVLTDFLYGGLEDEDQNSHLTPETVEALLALNDLTLEATNFIIVADNVNAFSENDLTLRASAIGVLSARLGQSGGGNIILETSQSAGNFVLVRRGLLDTDVLRGSSVEGGNVSIITRNLFVNSFGVISASTFGEGNAGQVEITAIDDVVVDGIFSFVVSEVVSGAIGNSGGVLIRTGNLSVLNNAGIGASTGGEGNSGQVEIIATGNIVVDGRFSSIVSEVIPGGIGNSNGVLITTGNLSVLNTGAISASTFGRGNSGQVEIMATGNVVVDGTDSFIGSTVAQDGIGNSGGVLITVDNLSVLNAALINATTFGEGDSGQVKIIATGDVIVDGASSLISTAVAQDGIGDSGGVLITTDNLSVLNDAAVSANTIGKGDSGQIKIMATGDVIVDGTLSSIVSEVISGGIGDSGGVLITTDNLSVLNAAVVSASAFGEGNSGQIKITATGDVIVDGTDSFVGSTVAQGGIGDSGGVLITTDNLSVLNAAVVSSSTFGEGNSGQMKITATGDVIVDGTDSFISSAVFSDAIGNSDGISITTSNLSVLDGASLTTFTNGNGKAGILLIQSNPGDDLSVLLSENGSIDTLTASQETGGDLIITSDGALTIQGAGDLTTESLGINTGAAGNLNIVADSVLLNDGVELSAQTASTAGGGNINFLVDKGIILRWGSFINAESTNETPGSGSGGNITLDANFVLTFPDENSDIIANAVGGDGGNIAINAAGIFGFTEQGIFQTTDELRANVSSDISASSQAGQSGSINLNADFEQTQAIDELPDNFINADQLVASSCIARSNNADSAFVITGNDGLPQQPTETLGLSSYDTGTVQLSPEADVSQTLQEPEGIYQLADGRLVMGHRCKNDRREM
ncbi:S-layer family protein [Leptolyngbyaceae cyanobacterium CCMR0082]|uniref:S-layer family protein n=1 Tax=Adonisia turfae CCMR0082 TaxID=2304604 RepID=A0A6M0SED9_9CYAN|nr:S-layer family protein [Adonisia turfae]NEZ66403.1 S-layer family protein [Adonisia turfae CCMR0082]